MVTPKQFILTGSRVTYVLSFSNFNYSIREGVRRGREKVADGIYRKRGALTYNFGDIIMRSLLLLPEDAL